MESTSSPPRCQPSGTVACSLAKDSPPIAAGSLSRCPGIADGVRGRPCSRSQQQDSRLRRRLVADRSVQDRCTQAHAGRYARRAAGRWPVEINKSRATSRASSGTLAELGFLVERVTGIEPALSAWESDRLGPLTALTWTSDVPRVTVMDP